MLENGFSVVVTSTFFNETIMIVPPNGAGGSGQMG